MESRRFYRCWECDEEFLVTAAAERQSAGPVLFCPSCGSVGVEPVEESHPTWIVWAQAHHAPHVH